MYMYRHRYRYTHSKAHPHPHPTNPLLSSGHSHSLWPADRFFPHRYDDPMWVGDFRTPEYSVMRTKTAFKW